MTIGIREKLAITLFLVTAALTLPWFGSLLLMAMILIARSSIVSLRSVDGASAARFRKFLTMLLLLAVVMTLLNGALILEGRVLARVGPVEFFQGGIEFGLATGSRLLLIATAFLVLFGSTRMAEFADYLNRIGLPGPIVTTLLLSLHFLDHLPARIQDIYTAQESRGAPVRGRFWARVRSFFLLLLPLVLSSIVEALDRNVALEMRGFHSGMSLRTSPQAAGSRQRTLLVRLFTMLTVLLILYRLLAWLTPLA